MHNKQLGFRNELRAWVHDKLAVVCETLGQTEMADTWAKKVLIICEETYPCNSTAVAYQKLRWARLKVQNEDMLAAKRRYDTGSQAMQTLCMHYGDRLEL